MQFLGRFCLLFVVCSALELYKRILQVFFGLLLMDFASFLKLSTMSSELKCGFLLLGCFSLVFSILGFLLMFGLGLKYLHITWHGKGFVQFFYEIRGKSVDANNGLCSKLISNEVLVSKVIPYWFNSLKFLENSKSRKESNILVFKEADDPNDDPLGDKDDDDGSNFCVEDEEFDVMELRRLVKSERHKAEMANLELEKERMACASAANEAMAMISRLQWEKSSIEIEANQYRRMAEQQRAHDGEVIQTLQWIIMKYESERDELVKNLKFCEQKLNLLMKTNEFDEFEDFDFKLNLDADITVKDGLGCMQ